MHTIFSNNLRKLRLQKNLTQEQVAEILGVNAQTISRWECNTTYPDILLLPQIAQLYCVTVDDLFKTEVSAYENYAQRLASVYEKTGNPEDYLKADAEFRKLKKAGTYSLEDCRIHGIIHASMMSYCKRAAIQNFNTVIDACEKDHPVSPDNITYWRTRYQILHYSVETGAIEHVCALQKEKVKMCKENHMEWSVLIYAYYYAGKFETAYQYFVEAKTKFPDKWEIYEIGSNVCRMLRKFNEAIECCNKTLEFNPTHLDAVYAKAFCLEEMGDYKCAYDAWVSITDALKREGRTAEALREEKRAQACLEKINQ